MQALVRKMGPLDPNITLADSGSKLSSRKIACRERGFGCIVESHFPYRLDLT